jgi:hypothetical protein
MWTPRGVGSDTTIYRCAESDRIVGNIFNLFQANKHINTISHRVICYNIICRCCVYVHTCVVESWYVYRSTYAHSRPPGRSRRTSEPCETILMYSTMCVWLWVQKACATWWDHSLCICGRIECGNRVCSSHLVHSHHEHLGDTCIGAMCRKCDRDVIVYHRNVGCYEMIDCVYVCVSQCMFVHNAYVQR